MPTVVLGVTGCIGAYKACEVLRELQKRDVDVHVVMTEAATRFVTPMTFEALSRHPVFVDQFALGEQSDIRHISLADAADLLLVAPATANILGKFARGIADDALSTLYTATKAPVLVAPAMNVNMFDHPAVVENLEILRARGRGHGGAGLGLPGLRMARQGAAGRGRGHRGRGHARLEPAHRPRGRDRARHRGSDRRGHRPRALRLQPLHRAHGVPHRGSGARSRRARGPRLRAHVAAPARRRRARRACARRRRWRGRWASTSPRPRSWSWRRPSPTTARRRVAHEDQEDGRPGGARPGAHARHPARPGRGQGRPVPGGLRGRDRRRARERAQEAGREAARPDRGQRRRRGRTPASPPSGTPRCSSTPTAARRACRS